ncbi:uncharacterized protein K02A2.6-like [Myzus persicae]|uniref:uncharacterized protein K02A2.6-like n=1 Tax=Myzus persicae TaxID=13164 RepID=UPI000B932B4D|nr:uncharacterized protein K02A2.6-like [Myzus persicae]
MDTFLLTKLQLPELALTTDKIAFATANDPKLKKVYKEILLGSIGHDEYSIHDGCILYRTRIWIPKILQGGILRYLHIEHGNPIKLIGLALSYHVYWPSIDEDIFKLTKHCHRCIAINRAPCKAHVSCWKVPTEPWERIHIDYAGPFMKRLFLLVIDEYSMWPEVFILKSSSASNVIEKLQLLFSRFGQPKVLISDNVMPFMKEEFQTFLKSSGIEHFTSIPNNAESYKKVERLVFSLKRALIELKGHVGCVQNKLNTILFTWRRSQTISTVKSPAQLFLGRELRSNLDLLKPTVDKVSKITLKEEDPNPSQLFHYGQKVAVRYGLNGYILNADSSDYLTLIKVNGEEVIHHKDKVIPFPVFKTVLDTQKIPDIQTVPVMQTVPVIQTVSVVQPVPDTQAVLPRMSKRTIKPRERLNL